MGEMHLSFDECCSCCHYFTRSARDIKYMPSGQYCYKGDSMFKRQVFIRGVIRATGSECPRARDQSCVMACIATRRVTKTRSTRSICRLIPWLQPRETCRSPPLASVLRNHGCRLQPCRLQTTDFRTGLGLPSFHPILSSNGLFVANF